MNIIKDLDFETGTFRRGLGLPGIRLERAQRVWLVDDDDMFRALLAKLLDKTQGLECAGEFSSGELMLSALAREVRPDTILLDVQLCGRNGIDFIQPIKALAPDTRVFVLTTFYDPDSAIRALAAGAADFLLKRDTFDRVVERILEAESNLPESQGTSKDRREAKGCFSTRRG